MSLIDRVANPVDCDLAIVTQALAFLLLELRVTLTYNLWMGTVLPSYA